MAQRLTDVEVEEMSAVDRPANKAARILLLKRESAESSGSASGPDSKADSCAETPGGMLNLDRAELVSRLKKLLGTSSAQAPGSEEGKDPVADTADKQGATPPEALEKRLAALEKADQESKDQIQKLKDENAQLRKANEQSEAKVKFRKELPEPIRKSFDAMAEKDQDGFMSSFTKADGQDDPVAKALKASAAEQKRLEDKLAKLERETNLQKLEGQFKDLDGFVDVAKFAQDYAVLSKADQSAADRMVESQRALVAQAKAGGLFKTIGRDGGGESLTAQQRIEKAAEAEMKADPKLTKAQATDLALRKNPKLYTESLDEKKGA